MDDGIKESFDDTLVDTAAAILSDEDFLAKWSRIQTSMNNRSILNYNFLIWEVSNIEQYARHHNFSTEMLDEIGMCRVVLIARKRRQVRDMMIPPEIPPATQAEDVPEMPPEMPPATQAEDVPDIRKKCRNHAFLARVEQDHKVQ